MRAVEAQAELLAIALQESGLKHRRQRVFSNTKQAWIDGPARSMYQFELGGLAGVLRHPATQAHAARVVGVLGYADQTPLELLDAMIEDDILASCMARLNLFWDPARLPTREEGPQPAYEYYDRVWRPGKKRPHDWAPNWARAWEAVA